ncbi:3'-5' exonuclease [Deinococcus sp. PESE-13]
MELSVHNLPAWQRHFLEQRRGTLPRPLLDTAAHLLLYLDDAGALHELALERLAAQALAEPQVRQYYARRWKALLVDEFQDTSPLQWEIISALSEHSPNLTVVGDEKQSIYAFRGADVTLFRKARHGVALRGGESRALTTSFRTHHALVEVVNTFFEGYMPGPLSPESTAATFAPLKASRQSPLFPGDACEFHVISGPALKDTLREAEARLIAHRVQSLLGEGRTVSGKAGDRPLAYHDIAVLLRTRTHLAQYEAALFTAGIPYVVQGGTGLLRRPEVRDLRSLLQFLANPADDLALAATLRSPFIGWADERLVAATSSRPSDRSLWHSLTEPPELLSRLLAARPSHSASALITLALEDSDFGPVMASMADGQRRLANIDAFLGLLHRYAVEGRGGVQQVSHALQESVRLDLPVAEATLGSDDAVQLMTIHGSKGLEYPVVIIPDLLAEGRADSPPLLMHEERGLSLRIPGVKPDDHPQQHRLLLDLAAEQRLAESERIKYVALTRAADTLILCLTAKTSELSAAQRLAQFLPQANVARFNYRPEEIPPVERRSLPRTGEVYLTRTERGVALPDHLPVTSIGVYLRCPREFEYRYVTGRPPFTALWEPDTRQREGGVSGALIGSAVHQALELGLNDMQIQGQFTHLSSAERREVGQLVATLQEPAFKELLVQQPQRELQVTYPVGDLTFEGVIDALYDGWVVDYKTDRRMEPADHLPQLSLYSAATGAQRASLAYLRHAQLHHYSAADLQQGTEQVERMVGGVQALEFSPTPAPTRCRFCSYRQVCDAALVEG